jgi:mannose-6-phosphate isomerase-like protein (cupin superfamily)
MVLLGGVAATIRAGAETIEAAPESLTIVPPGPSEVVAKGVGYVVRVLSNRATDLLAKAENAATYADGATEVAPLVDWPQPPDGFKLRNYKPFEYDKPDTNMRLFRCTNLMINVLTKRTAPRDVTKLSPHSHDDFEQASLLLEGDYIHHLRYPWVPDMSQWRADEHVEIGSPSVTVIPPKVVHTSRNIGDKRSWLIDIFSPPRVDFSRKPGLVLNADEYPMPEGLQ